MKKSYTSGINSLMKMDKDEKQSKKIEVKQIKKSLGQLSEDEKNGDHISSILRLSSDGDDLISPDKINSQNMMNMIIEEDSL